MSLLNLLLLLLLFQAISCGSLPRPAPDSSPAPKAATLSSSSSRLGPQDTSGLLPAQPVAAWESFNFLQHLWSERYRFYACLVPKCGSTAWLELIFKMHLNTTAYQRQSVSVDQLHSHTSYPMEGLLFRPRYFPHARLNNATFEFPANDAGVEARAISVLSDRSFFKFAIVRHPWNRLVSAFIDKYVMGCRKSRVCFRSRYQMPVSIRIVGPLSLTELLLAVQHIPHFKIDRHFRPTTEICDIGRAPYDFIADSDNPAHMRYLLAKIESPQPLQRSNDVKPKMAPEDRRVQCTRETVDLAARLYAKDLEAYGYTMDAAYESCEKYGLAFPPE